MDRIKKIIIMLLEYISRQRKAIIACSCLVVFITTYLLILPAFTLEKDEATDLGGIDVPGSVVEETTSQEMTQADFAADTSSKDTKEAENTEPKDEVKDETTSEDKAGSEQNNETPSSKNPEIAESVDDTKSAGIIDHYNLLKASPHSVSTKNGDVEDLDHNKTLTPNLAENGEWDGTYTLSLDIVGKKTSSESVNVNKADVIIVMDNSSSMNMDNNGTSRFELQRDAVKTFGSNLLDLNKSDPNAIQLSVMTYGTLANDPFIVHETNKDSFVSAIDGMTPPPSESTPVEEGGQATNWEDALKKADAISTRSDAEKYVIFISDGNPTVRNTQGEMGWNGSTFESAFHNARFKPAGYDVWGYGFDKPPADSLFDTETGRIWIENMITQCYLQSRDYAKSMVDSGKNFYTISVVEEIPRMEQLAAYAYSGYEGGTYPEGHYNTAKNAGDLSSIFSSIFESASESIKYQNVKITDTLTIATKSILQIDGHANDFKYYKNGDEWEGAPEASYSNGKVDWDLSSVGALEDGVTYTVAFTVWPNQNAYDAILKLNEGTASIEDIQRDYPDIAANLKEENGKYNIYSNGEATVSYDKITTINGEEQEPESKTLNYPRPVMETLQYKMKVAKVWKDSLYANNRPNSIKFNVYEDGELYTQITLTSDNAVSDERWEAEIPISPGIISNKIIDGVRLNQGHVYTVEEALEEGATSDYHYDFDPEELTPMLDDGTMHFLGDNDGDESLSGTNHMRGSMTISKKVIDAEGNDISSDESLSDVDFSFKVYLRDSEGNAITGKTEDDDDAIWYRLLDENGDEIGSATVINSGDVFTLKAGHSLRLLNLPRTMSYKVEEIDIPQGYEFDSEEYDYVDEDNDPEVKLIPDEDGYCVAQPNTWQYVTVTNKVNGTHEAGSLKIRKSVSENGSNEVSTTIMDKLAGTYTFGIFTDEECTKPLSGDDGTPVKVTISIGNDGVPVTSEEVTSLEPGDYWIKEILPSNDSLPDTNPVKVTVEAGKTGDAAPVANFINDYETTNISVTKQWSDNKNHANDTITFALYQVAENSEGEVLREAEYSGEYTKTITNSGTVNITGLPTKGAINNQAVTYRYYVSETNWPAGYVPIVSRENTDDGTAFTIKNLAHEDKDETTSLAVTKIWKDEDGSDAAAEAHDNDTITFKLTQKVAKSNYVPVIVNFYNADGSLSSTENYYVKKGTSLEIEVEKPWSIDSHGVRITKTQGGDYSWAMGGSGSHSFSIPINTSMTINAQLQYREWYLLLGWISDVWGNAPEYHTSGLHWKHDVSGADIKNSLNDVISGGADPATATEQSYSYELKKDAFVGETPFNPTADGWTANFAELPLFKVVDGEYYIFEYSIDEIAVNGEPVVSGMTDEYLVAVDQENNTITNTKRPKVDVEATKAWLNADETTTAPTGGKVTFELYTDGKATGKTVELDGTVDTESAYYESAAWKALWKDLPKYSDYANSQEISYTVKEISGFAPYVNQNPDGVASGETITNKEKSFDLEILKVDKTDSSKKLENATFTIRKIKSDEAPGKEVKYDGEVIDTQTTSSDGKAAFSGITSGYYEVRESQLPEGYVSSEDSAFYIKVDKDGVHLIQCDLTKPATEWEEILLGGIVSAFAIGSGETPAQATVVNEPGFELPHTGGIGTTIFYMLGTVLVLGCGMVMASRRRIKRSDIEE